MRAEAAVRLRLNVGAYEQHRRMPTYVERALEALRGADERPRRMLVHAAIVGTAAVSAAAALMFGA